MKTSKYMCLKNTCKGNKKAHTIHRRAPPFIQNGELRQCLECGLETLYSTDGKPLRKGGSI